ncbi:hypothetical protein L7F22_003986 [Adiantum nelumboides]|nr:hypothetical protein [Adiantum nelumboides]
MSQGQELHAEIMFRIFKDGKSHISTLEAGEGPGVTDTPLENVLVDMYVKCGSMLDAETLVEALPVMDTLAWNAIIAGYARQGESKIVLQVFDMMKQQHAQVDLITFLGILTACSHAGLVDEGQKYFIDMDRVYGIAPGIVHYNCIIDLLGRAGRFGGLINLLENMSFEPNLDTWQTLLGACSKWGNVEVGRLAFDSAMKLDKSNAAAFIVMSNMYTEAQEGKRMQELSKLSNPVS